jgi:type II pantothenate kinase
MESLVNGMAFVLTQAKEAAFTFNKNEGKKVITEGLQKFPKLLVSIGSGVSIIKVNDFNSYERVAGTMIGGGTLLGLANLLTGINDFDHIIELSQKGNHAEIDMLVKDIYGS